MTMRDALKIARQIAGNDADTMPHYGDNPRKDRAVRITNCFLSAAQDIGARLARQIDGTVRQSGDGVLVWL